MSPPSQRQCESSALRSSSTLWRLSVEAWHNNACKHTADAARRCTVPLASNSHTHTAFATAPDLPAALATLHNFLQVARVALRSRGVRCDRMVPSTKSGSTSRGKGSC